jgi:hypothetical protein
VARDAVSGAALAAVETPLRLTAIVLLLRPTGPWWVRPLILGLAALALILPSVLRSQWAWTAVAVALAVALASDWPLPDNHIYLLGYWCLSIALALGSGDPRRTLGAASRWLLGLAFVFAVLWKAVLSPDYLDGRFFRVTLMTDDRFADAAMLLGGLSREELRRNREILRALPEGAELLDPPTLHEPPRFRMLAAFATYGALASEAIVAVLCLLPDRRSLRRARLVALLAFCAVTYAFAPVAGFGWLILVMGLAQTQPDEPIFRGLFIAVFLAVLFYAEVPWAGVLVDWRG